MLLLANFLDRQHKIWCNSNTINVFVVFFFIIFFFFSSFLSPESSYHRFMTYERLSEIALWHEKSVTYNLLNTYITYQLFPIINDLPSQNYFNANEIRSYICLLAHLNFHAFNFSLSVQIKNNILHFPLAF